MEPQASDVVNTDQAEAWNDTEGRHWAAHADDYDQGVRRHQEHLLTAAALSPADRVLDIGCGNGASTLAAARSVPEGRVTGADLSAPMLEVARRRAEDEGLTNVEFVQADAQIHPFEPGGADVVISRFGAMFFLDLVAGYRNLARALRPGGRLAVVAWQAVADNEWLTSMLGTLAAGREIPMPAPGTPGTAFGLADEGRTRQILDDAGFTDVEVDSIREPLMAGQDADSAFDFFSEAPIASGMMADLDDAQRAEALAAMRRLFEQHETPDGVQFGSAAWLITARRP